MEYIKLGLGVLVVLFVYMAITGIFMKAANYVGERLGIGKFFINLCKNIRKCK